MICGKCGNLFSSRGYLLAHTCRVLSDHILLNEDENIQSEHSDEFETNEVISNDIFLPNENENIQSAHNDKLIELAAILSSNSPSVTEYNVVLPMDCSNDDSKYISSTLVTGNCIESSISMMTNKECASGNVSASIDGSDTLNDNQIGDASQTNTYSLLEPLAPDNMHGNQDNTEFRNLTNLVRFTRQK